MDQCARQDNKVPSGCPFSGQNALQSALCEVKSVSLHTRLNARQWDDSIVEKAPGFLLIHT